ncbi:uncharacterized protein LOC127261350 isoform X2 [Andrographis paniculata]|nr:uncharacterized protein LOC127261350 isoform X2 [Andrographis paniculata]XP_051145625.1 uncharacterized protein LOC127261350 isoform X2 [Andrographis paniculata]
MAKGTRGRRGVASRQLRSAPYPIPSSYNVTEVMPQKDCSKLLEKKDWEDATCSVCMECPHNAVLLLCSSHDKGCRPYMCGTSIRYSNCLDQYKKAYTKLISSNSQPLQDSFDSQITRALSSSHHSLENCEALELACPLCRGQVKGWTVVEPARDYLNGKKRTCMQDNCLFIGTYRELRKHVKAEHPSAKPRQVDPTLEQKWRRMERERERDDVISTIRSSMPGAVVFGDYVIEGSPFDINSEDEDGFDADAIARNEGIEVSAGRDLMSVFVFLQAFGSAGNVIPHRGVNHNSEQENSEDEDGNGDGDGHVHRGRVVLGRSGRRRLPDSR